MVISNATNVLTKRSPLRTHRIFNPLFIHNDYINAQQQLAPDAIAPPAVPADDAHMV